MALIGCPECARRISEYAESCPNCGYILELGEADEIKKAEAQERERTAQERDLNSSRSQFTDEPSLCFCPLTAGS